MSSASVARPRVVILGCGFGGLWAAQALRAANADVTVIDRTNHHLFSPLLYQVATAGLSAPAITAPIRHILAGQRNATVLLGEAVGVDVGRREVRLEDGETLAYDRLIVATGTTHSYFGNDDWAPFAPGLKTLDDAFEIRSRILLAFERAERETDAARRAAWLTFVVIGAGATGVELAGTLAEIARHTLKGEFRRFDPRNSRIVLVEAGERVLPPYTPDLSEKARLQLERLGVTVWVGRRVTGVDERGVTLGDDRLEARTVIWAAGVASSPIGRTLDAPLDRAGRVQVAPDLSLPGHPEVYVIGDLAAVTSDGKPVPGIAPAAKQMGRHAARNILLALEGKRTQPFRYRDYGQLATIGRAAAVVMMGKLRLSGFPAWLLWLGAHIYFLINFRNRVVVMIDWASSYWTYSRYARIFTRRSP
ncbi:MAG TPA: NAD(P)/FAD-dependent oxidoreductase [Burkholderiales bacterium]|jgi:NADH dehydrogenase|nr:NAD(P)/FAD-dependent oxidoreductase [Burkholderiales bacterium]